METPTDAFVGCVFGRSVVHTATSVSVNTGFVERVFLECGAGGFAFVTFGEHGYLLVGEWRVREEES